jgi:hypothetical protein
LNPLIIGLLAYGGFTIYKNREAHQLDSTVITEVRPASNDALGFVFEPVPLRQIKYEPQTGTQYTDIADQQSDMDWL